MLGPTARDRLDVWVAVGVLMVRAEQSSADALAMLRAHAYAHDQSLDDLAVDVINGKFDSQEFRD